VHPGLGSDVTAGTVILGGGLAGLSAAYHSDGDFLLFERASRVGGLCRTEWVDGFGFDRAIHILYTSDDALAALICEDILGGEYHEQVRRARVYSHGALTDYPFQANLYGLPPSVVQECLVGLHEARCAAPGRPRPTNFAEWITDTFGHGIAKHFMLPYNRRVWSVPPEEMHHHWIAGRVPVPDFGEVVAGALRPGTRRFGPNAAFWYPVRGGIEELPRRLAAKLEADRLRLGTEITRIDTGRRLVRTASGECHPYERLLSSLPLPAMARLICDVPDDVMAAITRLRANTVVTVLVGVARAAVHDAHWIYFPEAEFPFHRISFPMNFSPSLVPPGCSSILAEFSVAEAAELDGRDLVAETVQGLRRAGILRDDDEVVASATITLCPAYVIYDHAHRAVVDRIHAWLESEGITPIGRFGEWEYFNMDQAIESGRRAVATLPAMGSGHSDVPHGRDDRSRIRLPEPNALSDEQDHVLGVEQEVAAP
jgi:UDP-galactopyranose mutase